MGQARVNKKNGTRPRQPKMEVNFVAMGEPRHIVKEEAELLAPVNDVKLFEDAWRISLYHRTGVATLSNKGKKDVLSFDVEIPPKCSPKPRCVARVVAAKSKKVQL